jgi:hypothetical protein
MAADFGVLDSPAGVFAFSTALNSCRETVYVPYRALNRVFPVRALQNFLLSAALTMDDHCSLSPTEAGGVPCHVLNVAEYFKLLFQMRVGVGKLSY